jgi:integrase
VIPLHPEAQPFIEEALEASTNEHVFPGITEDTDLPAVLRRGLADAGLTTGFEHRCKGWRCGHREMAKDREPRFCPKPKHRRRMRLHPTPLVRQLRFHDLRHTAVHLLFDAGLDAAVVQAMARHRDSKTTQRYAHLRADWALRKIENMSLLSRYDAPQLHSITALPAPAPTHEKEKAPETAVISDA